MKTPTELRSQTDILFDEDVRAVVRLSKKKGLDLYRLVKLIVAEWWRTEP